MLFNCLGWVTYAILINNLFVFFGNIFALILAIWLNMIALELQYADFRTSEIRQSLVLAFQNNAQEGLRASNSNENTEHASPLDVAKIMWDVAALNTKAPVAHKSIILVLATIWTALLSTICLGQSLSQYTKELIIGVAVNLNLVFFYGSPLSTILTVLQTRSSSTIHIPTCFTMFLNGFFWTVFGFAVVDWFIAIPNLMGAILGAAQFALCMLFPRRTAPSSTKPEDPESPVADDGGKKDISGLDDAIATNGTKLSE